MEYARQLDRLHRSYKPRKEERNKEFWRFLAPWDCWESVIKSVEKQYRFHSKLYGIYTNNISNRLADLENDVQSLQKRCRDMGAKAHEQILKCLNELQSSLKVYNYTQQVRITLNILLLHILSLTLQQQCYTNSIFM